MIIYKEIAYLPTFKEPTFISFHDKNPSKQKFYIFFIFFLYFFVFLTSSTFLKEYTYTYECLLCQGLQFRGFNQGAYSLTFLKVNFCNLVVHEYIVYNWLYN